MRLNFTRERKRLANCFVYMFQCSIFIYITLFQMCIQHLNNSPFPSTTDSLTDSLTLLRFSRLSFCHFDVLYFSILCVIFRLVRDTNLPDVRKVNRNKTRCCYTLATTRPYVTKATTTVKPDITSSTTNRQCITIIASET